MLAAGVLIALFLTSSSASATALDPGTRSPDAARIATGDGFSCGIDDGRVMCWGSGAYGELGTGNSTDHSAPVAVVLGDGRSAIQVVAGDHHACALLADGSVRCWGRNNDGQLGYGKSVTATTTNGGPDAPGNASKTPAAFGVVSLGRSAIALSAGGDNTCALLNNGLIRCWGNGASGEDGTGHTANVGDDEKPSDLPSIDLGNEAIAIATGGSHSCALLDDGTVRCWGSAAFGQLGYGNKTNIGDNESAGHGGAVDLGSAAVAISAGGVGSGDAQPGQPAGDHTCAVLSTGAVLCWGYGGDGALGNGGTANIGDNELPVSAPVVPLGADRTAISVSVGADHTCAVLDNGAVRCWGNGAGGRLGTGSTDSTLAGPTGSVDAGGPVVAVSAGGSQTCARLGDGTIHCWGDGSSGQLGYGDTKNVGDGLNGDATPASAGAVDTGATPEVRQVAAGGAHTCALASDGTVRCWGEAIYGQLGYGNTNEIGGSAQHLPSSAGTVNVGGPVKEIAAGGDHTCALRADGLVYCWGSGAHGELGYGNTNNVGDGHGDKSPLAAGAVPLGATATAIVAGDAHTCAILSDGGVRCWGQGTYGELGYGSTNDIGDNEPLSQAPTEVSTGGQVRALQAGFRDTCAIVANGDSRCWGSGTSGRLGYGDTVNIGAAKTPSEVDPISLGANRRGVGFAEGAGHTCVAMDNGAVRCWGGNPDGELGYGNTKAYSDKPTKAGPVDLGSGRYSRLIDAGLAHTCVVMDNGQLSCWGQGFSGRLGYGNTNNIGDNETPAGKTVNVGAGRSVVSISLGDAHTCAVLDDGTLRCWGAGLDGRLGTGSSANIGDNETPDKVGPVHLFDVPPVAVPDELTVAEGAAATAVNVRANDTDSDGGPKSVVSVTQPAHGQAAVTGGGTGVSYQPAAGFCGSDSFTYTLNGGSQATVAVTVTCVDHPPVAVDDTVTVAQDAGATPVAVLANDTDSDGGPKSVVSVTQPAHGQAAVTGGGTGVSYQPAAGFCGSDSFTYTLNGGSTGTVAVTVTCASGGSGGSGGTGGSTGGNPLAGLLAGLAVLGSGTTALLTGLGGALSGLFGKH